MWNGIGACVEWNKRHVTWDGGSLASHTLCSERKGLVTLQLLIVAKEQNKMVTSAKEIVT